MYYLRDLIFIVLHGISPKAFITVVIIIVAYAHFRWVRQNIIVTDRCDVYNLRSILHSDGKLLFDDVVAKCRNKY